MNIFTLNFKHSRLDLKKINKRPGFTGKLGDFISIHKEMLWAADFFTTEAWTKARRIAADVAQFKRLR